MNALTIRAALVAVSLGNCWTAAADPLSITDDMLLNAAKEPNNWKGGVG